jgi:aryl-alcohol dehydrogenase-like predicted oxidoreductase
LNETFLFYDPLSAIPISGAKNEDQVRQNTGCLGWRLSKKDVHMLDSIAFEGKTDSWQHG